MSAEEARVTSALAGAIRHHWRWFLGEGIVLLILGVLALLAPAIASLAATVFFGWILFISGVVGLIATFRARRVAGYWWSMISAAIGIVAGLLLLSRPGPGTLSLTAVLIAFLIAEGIVSILYAVEHRSAVSGRWGWMLASGIIDVCLGGLLLAGFPGTAVWALGLVLGINLLFGGWALVLMALHARALGASPS
jgi:uncharacterized membrane protein HdeD (DUF308 family)